MSAIILATVAQRVASICAAAPFSFAQAQEPFSFDRQPSGRIDQVFRIEHQDVASHGSTSFAETRLGQVRIFLARKQLGAPTTAYYQLSTDANSLTAAVTRDGVTNGDYDVPDDSRGFSIAHDDGQEYAVLRLVLPISYEAQL